MANVTIHATDDTVDVTINHEDGRPPEEFNFAYPGMITGCELRDILLDCGVQVDYQYKEEGIE